MLTHSEEKDNSNLLGNAKLKIRYRSLLPAYTQSGCVHECHPEECPLMWTTLSPFIFILKRAVMVGWVSVFASWVFCRAKRRGISGCYYHWSSRHCERAHYFQLEQRFSNQGRRTPGRLWGSLRLPRSLPQPVSPPFILPFSQTLPPVQECGCAAGHLHWFSALHFGCINAGFVHNTLAMQKNRTYKW